MKRNMIMTLATFVTLAMLGGSLLAKDAAPRGKKGGDADAKKRDARRPRQHRRMPDIGLTDAQKKEIGELRKTAMTNAKDAKPEERKAIFEKLRKDVHALLTEEQAAKMKAMHKDGPKRGARPELNLTDEQKAKMTELRKATAAKMKDAKPEEKKAIMENMKKQMATILTPEQLEKLKKAHKGGRPGGDRPDLGLTDEQKKKMDALRKETHAKMKDAKGEEKKAIMENMKAQVAKILTPEQLEKFKKAHQNRRRGGDKGEGKGKGKPERKRGGKKRPAAE